MDTDVPDAADGKALAHCALSLVDDGLFFSLQSEALDYWLHVGVDGFKKLAKILAGRVARDDIELGVEQHYGWRLVRLLEGIVQPSDDRRIHAPRPHQPERHLDVEREARLAERRHVGIARMSRRRTHDQDAH